MALELELELEPEPEPEKEKEKAVVLEQVLALEMAWDHHQPKPGTM